MTLSEHLTERAEAYVRKPALTPTFPGSPDGPTLARSARHARAEVERLKGEPARLGVRPVAEPMAAWRQAMGGLRTLAMLELLTPATPED